jgi:hypothetical protein
MSSYLWISPKYPRVRYREHPARKQRNGQADRYFTIRYRDGTKQHEERLGWASEGWNAEKAHGVLASLKKGITTGSGPQSLDERRERRFYAVDGEHNAPGARQGGLERVLFKC